MGYRFPASHAALLGTAMIMASTANADLQAMEDQEMRAITGGSALQYFATDISYNLSQLTGVNYDANNVRTETRTVTEEVNATVHRLQINGSGEFHAHFEELVLGDYGGANNSIYKEGGQGVPDVDLENFGFGTSANNPFYFEDPYIEVQKQHHADGSTTIRGLRIGFGNARGTTPITINSLSGYIPTTSLLTNLDGSPITALNGGLVKAMVYGSGTKDTFVALLDDSPPDGTGNYPQTGGVIGGAYDNVKNSIVDVGAGPGGKELNLSHVRSLDYNDVKNFYISLTQGGGGSLATADGTVNGALWSQHLNGIVPQSRPDLPGWNMVIPYNDPTNAAVGALEAHVDMLPALSQMIGGIGDDNPRQSYQPVF